MSYLRLLPLLALAFSVTAAHAQGAPERAYLRVGAGLSQWQAVCEGTQVCDRRDTGVQLGVGYRVFGALAVEAAVVDFGRLRLADAVLDARAQAQGLLLGAAWHLELAPSITASVRGGVAQIESSERVTSASGTAISTRSRTEPYLGASVGLRVSPQIALELAGLLTHLREDEQRVDLGRGRVGLVTLGARASF